MTQCVLPHLLTYDCSARAWTGQHRHWHGAWSSSKAAASLQPPTSSSSRCKQCSRRGACCGSMCCAKHLAGCSADPAGELLLVCMHLNFDWRSAGMHCSTDMLPWAMQQSTFLHLPLSCSCPRTLLLAALQQPVLEGVVSWLLQAYNRATSEHSKRLLSVHQFNAKFR